MALYKGDKDMPYFNKIFKDADDFFNNPLDLETLLRERRQLESLT